MSALNDIELEAYRRGQNDMAYALNEAAKRLGSTSAGIPFLAHLSQIGNHANLSFWDPWSKDSKTPEELDEIQATIDQAANGEWDKIFKSGEELTVISAYPDIFYRWPDEDEGGQYLHLNPDNDEEFMDWEDVEVI